ncbi:MAG TPA: hypothetical protein VIY48_12550 [Candidatus Paceibacterota bacterium]
MDRSRRASTRVYYLGLFMVVIGITLWVYYAVIEVGKQVTENYTQARCNQGLLLLDLGSVDRERLSQCDPSVVGVLEEKYNVSIR